MSPTRSPTTWPTPEFTFPDGVVQRVPVTPEQARRWFDGQEALGMGRGEPRVDEDGRLVEHDGIPKNPTSSRSSLR